MKTFTIRMTTAFGLESLTKWQLERMDYDRIDVKNGYVETEGTMEDVAKLNLNLRTADRVYLVLKKFKATSFEELFDEVYDVDWPEILPKDGNFTVNGKANKAKLFSIRDSQSITEKAIVKKLQTVYPVKWFEKDGARYSVEFDNQKDTVSLLLDTSGEGLHKRGYRVESGRAPLRENLAAALVELSFYNKDRLLADPFCGSGTIAIEAARIARNIAPGIDRDFDFVHWGEEEKKIFKAARAEAMEAIDYDGELKILASDIDGGIVSEAIANAEAAGVREDINFVTRDFRKVNYSDNYGVLITNPPYGDRFMDKKQAEKLMKDLGKKMKKLKTWSWYVITNLKNFEKLAGKKADRRRKLYNGGIETTYYQYYGPKPQ